MALHNDLMEQSRQAKINAQQAGLSGDTRLQDFYNSSAEQSFIQAMNEKMKSDERQAEYQNYYAQQEQRKMQAEMRAQHDEMMRLQAERMEFEHEHWFMSLSPEDRKAYLEKKKREEKARLKAQRRAAEEERRRREEAWRKEEERRASLTPFQRKKEDILNSNAFAWTIGSIIMFGGGTLWAMFF